MLLKLLKLFTTFLVAEARNAYYFRGSLGVPKSVYTYNAVSYKRLNAGFYRYLGDATGGEEHIYRYLGETGDATGGEEHGY